MLTSVMLEIYISLVLVFSVCSNASMGYGGRRLRREIACPWKYQQITPGHSICLEPSNLVTDKGVWAADITTIVNLHNTIRREVSPTATNMIFMSWDEEIATTAQRWAENCVFSHDENYNRYAFGRFSVGQNVFMSWGKKMTWTQAIHTWLAEKNNFYYGINTASVGHYTQMIWAATSKVGCGYANCGGTHFHVCNYGPAGNVNNDLRTPYKNGTTCANCPDTCNRGLCDCSSLDVCLNGGYLDLSTCTCTCIKKLPFYNKPNCTLNCDAVQEPLYCSRMTVDSCRVFANVPQECPNKCGWCLAKGELFTTPVPSTSRVTVASTKNPFLNINIVSGTPATTYTTFTLVLTISIYLVMC